MGIYRCFLIFLMVFGFGVPDSPIHASEKAETVTTASTILQLPPEERAWLKSRPVLRFTGDPDWLPQEAFTANGKHIGIVADVLDLLELRLGVRLERVPVQTWSEAVRMAEVGEVDILSETATSERETMTFTEAYIKFPVVILAQRGAPAVSGRVTVCQCSGGKASIC
ncbi:transporter substrate-binding domain-containing protein, partial [Thermodesulfobacteriota bacterium]